MSIDFLISYFNNYLPLNEEEQEAVRNSFSLKKVRRRQYILQEGDICKVNTFIVSGCFRMFMVDNDGKEHNLQFAIENWWILDIESFYSEKPSKLYIEALEDSVVLQLKKEDQLNLFEFPKFNRVFRVFIENAVVSYQRRILQNISSTAEERYIDFMERYPSIFNRISNVQIASYLGITPEFLSIVRKRISS